MPLPSVYYLFAQNRIECEKKKKKKIFRAIKTEQKGFKVVPETTSDSISFYHIKMQVGVVA